LTANHKCQSLYWGQPPIDLNVSIDVATRYSNLDWQQLCTLLSSGNVLNSIENRTDLDGGLLPPIA